MSSTYFWSIFSSLSAVSQQSLSYLVILSEHKILCLVSSEAPNNGLGHFVDDYLLDFDIYHVSHVTELVMYIDAKYLSRELGEILHGVAMYFIVHFRWQRGQ